MATTTTSTTNATEATADSNDKEHQEVTGLNNVMMVEKSHDAAALQRLDDEYNSLHHQEQTLLEMLSTLHREEQSIRAAIGEASTSGIEKRRQSKRAKDAAIVARIESALFHESSSSSDDDDK